MSMTEEAAKALRAPFPESAIGKLPRAGIQLDYVGHAAVTDRLLSVDPEWSWEPVAFAEDGAPLIRNDGKNASLWVRLTVCGVTRYGVGSVAVNAFELDKQLISDALRNAAMRFGVALDLWSKEGLHDEVLDDRPVVVNHASKNEVDELSARIELLSPVHRDSFMGWKADQSFPWPWPSAAVVAMHRKLDEIVGAGEPELALGDVGGPDLSGSSEASGLSATAVPGAASPAPYEPVADASGEASVHGYDNPAWTKSVLGAQCEFLGLPHSGNRDRLIKELRAWNALNRPDFVEYDDPDLEPF